MKEHDNVKAGLFVLLGTLGVLAVAVALADVGSLFEPRQTVQVMYRLSDGLQGLKPGAAVTLGGQPVGQIDSIRDMLEPFDDPQRVVGKVVTARLPRRYRLFANAEVQLVVPTLGTGTTLNIRSVGSGQPLRRGQTLQGSLAGSALTANLLRDAGIQDAQRQQIRETIANLRDLSATLSRDVPAIAAATRTVLADAQPLAADARAAIAQLREASGSVNEVLGLAKQHSGQWVTNIDQTTEAAASLTTRLDALLTDKELVVRQTLDYVRTSCLHLRDILASNRPVLARMFASLELGASQLKLASLEIRRSPWRLLYKPGNRELDSENLYDAARSFALAASSLQSTAQSLDALKATDDPDPDDLQAMRQHLGQLFDRCRQAEREFWDALDHQASAEK